MSLTLVKEQCFIRIIIKNCCCLPTFQKTYQIPEHGSINSYILTSKYSRFPVLRTKIVGTLGSQVYFLAKVSCLVHLCMVVVHTAEIISAAAGFSQGQCHKWHYIPPSTPYTHTHEKQQPQFMLACRCDHDESKNVMMVETEWVLWNGGRKFLWHLIVGHEYHQNHPNRVIRSA